MEDLKRHEEFEMRLLDEMRKARVLDQLVFGGGTMLRLCFDLPRYSTDFDFYLKKKREDFLPWAKRLTMACQQMGAEITDQWEKQNSFLWEIRMTPYPRRLKIEIRKQPSQAKSTELAIAHSPYSTVQTRLRVVTLPQMWTNKIAALLDRREIRDAYDLEFLTQRGAGDFSSLEPDSLKKMATILNDFSEQDFRAVLGGVLPREERERVLSSRFAYLKSKITASIER